jgi:hypothetical protein
MPGRRTKQDPIVEAALMVRAIRGPSREARSKPANAQAGSCPEAATGALAALETLTGEELDGQSCRCLTGESHSDEFAERDLLSIASTPTQVRGKLRTSR